MKVVHCCVLSFSKDLQHSFIHYPLCLTYIAEVTQFIYVFICLFVYLFISKRLFLRERTGEGQRELETGSEAVSVLTTDGPV